MEPRFTLLQSEWWGRVREQMGWSRRSRSPLVLQRSIGPLRFAYAPHATASSGGDGSVTALADLFRRLGATDRSSGAAAPHLVRWDVPFSVDAFDEPAARAAGFVPAPGRVQPPDTVVVDLHPDEDGLLAAMKRKTRYNIRLAEKRGVTVTSATGGEAVALLPRWYALYRETAERDRISIHPERYYRTVLETAIGMADAGESAPRLSVYLAEHEGDLLSGIIVASHDGMSTYLYGASSNHKRNLMPSYLAQWVAIRDARTAGDHSYDMFGIPPTDDPGHPMHGLYRFKTGFGGAIVNRPGCWDLDLVPAAAGVFRTAERLRLWYHHRLRKAGRHSS